MNKEIWDKIIRYLDTIKPEWNKDIDDLGQLNNYLERQNGKYFSDEELFEGVVLGILSRGADYRSVHNNRQIIKHKFKNYVFSKEKLEFSLKDKQCLISKLIGRFTEDNINNAVKSSEILKKIINNHGSLNSFITDYCKSDVTQIIKSISLSKDYKIPGVGEVIASEIAKNWGFSAVKADQHILRAYACMGWIVTHQFIIDEQNDYSFPQWTSEINLEVKNITDELSRLINKPSTYIDNVIWYVCSTYGCHLTNHEIISQFGNKRADNNLINKISTPVSRSLKISAKKNNSVSKKRHAIVSGNREIQFRPYSAWNNDMPHHDSIITIRFGNHWVKCELGDKSSQYWTKKLIETDLGNMTWSDFFNRINVKDREIFSVNVIKEKIEYELSFLKIS